jgi:hypothetical protein
MAIHFSDESGISLAVCFSFVIKQWHKFSEYVGQSACLCVLGLLDEIAVPIPINLCVIESNVFFSTTCDMPTDRTMELYAGEIYDFHV